MIQIGTLQIPTVVVLVVVVAIGATAGFGLSTLSQERQELAQAKLSEFTIIVSFACDTLAVFSSFYLPVNDVRVEHVRELLAEALYSLGGVNYRVKCALPAQYSGTVNTTFGTFFLQRREEFSGENQVWLSNQ